MNVQEKERAKALNEEISALKKDIGEKATKLNSLKIELLKIQRSCTHESQKVINLGPNESGPGLYYCKDCEKFLGQYQI